MGVVGGAPLTQMLLARSRELARTQITKRRDPGGVASPGVGRYRYAGPARLRLLPDSRLGAVAPAASRGRARPLWCLLAWLVARSWTCSPPGGCCPLGCTDCIATLLRRVTSTAFFWSRTARGWYGSRRPPVLLLAGQRGRISPATAKSRNRARPGCSSNGSHTVARRPRRSCCRAGAAVVVAAVTALGAPRRGR
jgi:hypothetical protein